MKRRLLAILCSALVILMAGCTSGVLRQEPSVSGLESEAWRYDETLPVPIILGCSDAGTKAQINDVAALDDKIFGTFAINKDADTIETLFSNKVSQYQHERRKFIFGTTTDASCPEDYIYYPVDSEVNYSFYAYYAYQPDNKVVIMPESEVSEDGKKILVNMPVAKEADILWGKAETSGYGFNAHFLRQNKNQDVGPRFVFKHPAACLSFTASTAPGLTLQEGGYHPLIQHVKFYNLPTNAQLCIYDCEHSKEGTFIKVNERGTQYLTVKGGHQNLNAEVKGAEPAPVGDIFIAPQDGPLECGINIRWAKFKGEDAQGNKSYSVGSNKYYKFPIYPYGPDGQGGFEAGKRYRINLYIGYKGGHCYIHSIGSYLPD